MVLVVPYVPVEKFVPMVDVPAPTNKMIAMGFVSIHSRIVNTVASVHLPVHRVSFVCREYVCCPVHPVNRNVLVNVWIPKRICGIVGAVAMLVQVANFVAVGLVPVHPVSRNVPVSVSICKSTGIIVELVVKPVHRDNFVCRERVPFLVRQVRWFVAINV